MSGITDVAKGANVRQDVVGDVFEEILKRVRNGEQVRIKGFGTFEMRTYPGRTLRTPAVNDGAPITFEDSQMLKFRQSAIAKKRLNASDKAAKATAKGEKPAKAKVAPKAVAVVEDEAPAEAKKPKAGAGKIPGTKKPKAIAAAAEE
jgi:nucleoid DNA-binding protein